MAKIRIPFVTKHFSGSYIGGILETYQRSAVIVNAIQFLSVLIILYTTSAQPFIIEYVPWFTFPLYLLSACIGVLLLMVLVKILVIPSAYTFFNRQAWDNNNPMRSKLEKMEENQKKIMEKLGIEDK